RPELEALSVSKSGVEVDRSIEDLEPVGEERRATRQHELEDVAASSEARTREGHKRVSIKAGQEHDHTTTLCSGKASHQEAENFQSVESARSGVHDAEGPDWLDRGGRAHVQGQNPEGQQERDQKRTHPRFLLCPGLQVRAVLEIGSLSTSRSLPGKP